MKRLILMRHAKSSWDSDADSDHGRPLNGRGEADAPVMGEWLAELGWSPDTVLSSDSTRTRQTWDGVRAGLESSVTPRFSRSLYHAGIGQLQPLLAELTRAETVLVLGHNPGWSHAVSWLTGKNVQLTTANAALLESGETTWSAACLHPWRLVRVLRPKER